MPSSPPPPSRQTFRFALPPSLGADVAKERALHLARFLTEAVGKPSEVTVSGSYEGLAKDLLAGRVDAAWAPPFVCARVEAMGCRSIARGVRNGSSSYRAALVCTKGCGLTLETLSGKRAAWVDKDSVGGYLLPLAMLRAKGYEPQKLFSSQSFAGSYKAALEQVLKGDADVASVFAPASGDRTGADEILEHSAEKLSVVAFTEESPNDGVVISLQADPVAIIALERAILRLESSSLGAALLADVFSVDRFEPAPRMGYRSLYRVAMASL